MFNKQFNKSNYKDKPEKNSGKSKVETAGYVSAQQRIESLILSGRRLIESRRTQYDFEGEIDENFTDPTRKLDYDMADATQMKMSVESSLKASQNAQNQRIDVENKKVDQNPSKKDIEFTE